MPLRMVAHGGRFYPVVACDYCHRPIADAASGTYLWRHEDPTGAVHFVHQNCCRPYASVRDGKAAWLAGELQLLPLDLGHGLALDWQGARELAARIP